MIRRREFIAGISAAAWPLLARAQQAQRRVGVLMGRPATDAIQQSYFEAFIQGLRQAGWTEGRNLRIDATWNPGDANLANAYAAQLIGLMPDVILVSGRLAGHSASDQHGTRCVHAGCRPRHTGLC
jgi:putative tryptophan/tyrosine transport system substrate-binding protein